MHLEPNWIGAAVATLAGMAVGAVWYAGPVFGRAWRVAAALGPSAPENKPVAYGGALISTAVTAAVISVSGSMVSATLAVPPLPAALLVAGALWLGVAVARPLINLLFEGRSLRLFAIDSGHDLAVMLVAALAIGLIGL